jgi:hypothetical protein
MTKENRYSEKNGERSQTEIHWRWPIETYINLITSCHEDQTWWRSTCRIRKQSLRQCVCLGKWNQDSGWTNYEFGSINLWTIPVINPPFCWRRRRCWLLPREPEETSRLVSQNHRRFQIDLTTSAWSISFTSNKARNRRWIRSIGCSQYIYREREIRHPVFPMPANRAISQTSDTQDLRPSVFVSKSIGKDGVGFMLYQRQRS